jgi:cobalt-zinc-cadmium efflux system outer membrane protein
MNWISQPACEAGDILVAHGAASAASTPWVDEPIFHKARFSGRQTFCRPFRAHHHFCAPHPGLTPGATLCRLLRRLVVAVILTIFLAPSTTVPAQVNGLPPGPNATPTPVPTQGPTLSRYLDQTNGATADSAVAYALAHNGDLEAARKEIEAAQAMVKQARLRANPMLEAGGTQMIVGPDKSYMVSGSLPLELGGRRAARIAVAEREVRVREREVANRERMLAAEVRAKFGEGLAQALKLIFTDELIVANQQSFNLIAARVVAGATPPLEQNMALVELNRLRSMRESVAGKLEVTMFELRNLLGMKPEDPLRLRGDFGNLIDQLPTVAEATARALQERPDLQAFRAAENLAVARIAQARAEGRTDASLNAGYQRMETGFPLNGIDDLGALSPIMKKMNIATFGVTISLAVRNKNQGSIEAAFAESEAAKQRREFAELTVRREVASAYAQYERAARAMEIFRVGVREPARANLDVVRQTYELGSKTLIDYIGEQRRFIELENDFIDAELAVYNARVEIARASASPELIKK